MKKILFAAVFISTLIGGVATSNSVDIRGKIDAYVHQDCERWSEDWKESQLFTLDEAKALLNKKIIVKSPNAKTIRRIVDYQLIKKDKFAVAVYWEKSDTGENMRLVHLSKDVFEKDFVVLD